MAKSTKNIFVTIRNEFYFVLTFRNESFGRWHGLGCGPVEDNFMCLHFVTIRRTCDFVPRNGYYISLRFVCYTCIGSKTANLWKDWSSSSGLHPVDIPVLFCTACAMLSVNKSLYPTCTVPADTGTFKRHEHQLAIADAKAQVSLDHRYMHDINWSFDDSGQPVPSSTAMGTVNQSWTVSARRSSMEMVAHTRHHHFTPPPLVPPRPRQTNKIYISLRNVLLGASWKIAISHFVTIR